jgi:glycerophosphoryl diester phosphodiesterase
VTNQHFQGVRVGERAVNSLDAQYTTPACFAEVDFRFSADGVLVAAHDDNLGGSCGSVSHTTLLQLRQCRLADGSRVATLDDFLRVPLTEWYIDLKSNALADSDAAILNSVAAAVRAIERTGRERGAILMLYKTTPEAVALVHQAGVRAAMKGYPSTRAEAEALVDAAQAHQFEMVCIRITNVDQQMLDYSAARGVWHLTWELGDKTPAEWSELRSEGLGGLIVARYKYGLATSALLG